MYLENVYIARFKSFLGEHECSFSPGLNVIAGAHICAIDPLHDACCAAPACPNGSGKSNVLDAIRVCLTEDVSGLRVSSLRDLIAKAPATAKGEDSSAMVTVTFDNAGRKFAAQGLTSDKYAITCTLTPESRTFRLNGRQKSQKELREWLKAIGVDVENPAFLLQQGSASSIPTREPKELAKWIALVAGTALFQENVARMRSELARWSELERSSLRNIAALEASLAKEAAEAGAQARLHELEELIEAGERRLLLARRLRARAAAAAAAARRRSLSALRLEKEREAAASGAEAKALEGRLGSEAAAEEARSRAIAPLVERAAALRAAAQEAEAELEMERADAARAAAASERLSRELEKARGELARQQAAAASAADRAAELRASAERLRGEVAGAEEALREVEAAADVAAAVRKRREALQAALQREAAAERAASAAAVSAERAARHAEKAAQELHAEAERLGRRAAEAAAAATAAEKRAEARGYEASAAAAVPTAPPLRRTRGATPGAAGGGGGGGGAGAGGREEHEAALREAAKHARELRVARLLPAGDPTDAAAPPLLSLLRLRKEAEPHLLALNGRRGSRGGELAVRVAADSRPVEAMLRDARRYGRALRIWPLDRLEARDRRGEQGRARGPGDALPLELLEFRPEHERALLRAFGGWVLAGDDAAAAALGLRGIPAVAPDGTQHRAGELTGGSRGERANPLRTKFSLDRATERAEALAAEVATLEARAEEASGRLAAARAREAECTSVRRAAEEAATTAAEAERRAEAERERAQGLREEAARSAQEARAAGERLRAAEEQLRGMEGPEGRGGPKNKDAVLGAMRAERDRLARALRSLAGTGPPRPAPRPAPPPDAAGRDRGGGAGGGGAAAAAAAAGAEAERLEQEREEAPTRRPRPARRAPPRPAARAIAALARAETDEAAARGRGEEAERARAALRAGAAPDRPARPAADAEEAARGAVERGREAARAAEAARAGEARAAEEEAAALEEAGELDAAAAAAAAGAPEAPHGGEEAGLEGPGARRRGRRSRRSCAPSAPSAPPSAAVASAPPCPPRPPRPAASRGGSSGASVGGGGVGAAAGAAGGLPEAAGGGAGAVGRLNEGIAASLQRVAAANQDAFTRVAAAFAQHFHTLVPAWRGELRKTSPDGPVEEGVSFWIRGGAGSGSGAGEGGAWKESLEGLSGGQRTLLNLAFLVALAGARAGPLYLLDEVDAALDEENQAAVARLVASAFPASQVLCVSHHGSMQAQAERVLEVARDETAGSRVARTLDKPRPARAPKRRHTAAS
eukprot:tig00001366_g8393.t1